MTASSPALPVLGWERLNGEFGRRLLISLVVAAGAASVVLLGRLSGVLEGGAGLGAAVVLVLAVPTSRELSRRVLIAGCVVLGWTPLLWLAQPFPGFGRVTVGLVVLAGALGAWVAWSDRPLLRLQQLVPRMRVVDVLIPVTVVLGLLQLGPWLRAKTAAQSLGLLFSGWDNSAHFAMVSMIRHFGATVDALPAPPGGGRWQFESYPQGFHAVVASLMELQYGAQPGNLQAELLAYSQAVAMTVVLSAVLVVAGLCALAPLRRRPAIALPAAAFAGAVFYMGPAATAIQGGIGNFTLACALCIATALVALPAARALDPWTVLAIGGALVGVAFSWVLMLALAAPAALLVLLPLRRRWLWSRSAAIVTAVVAVVALCCLWRVLVVLGRVRATDPLTITSGGVPPVSLGLYAVGTLGLFAACLLVARQPARAVRQRLRALALVPICGIAVTVGLIIAQVDANDRVSYYGYKFMLGTEIVTLVLLVVPIAYALARLPARPRTVLSAVRVGAASLVLALGLTQVFGFTVLGFGIRGLVANAPGAAVYAAQTASLAVTPSVADLADRVQELQRSGDVPTTAFYVDARVDRSPDPILMAQWYLALSGTWTAEANDVVSEIDEQYYRRQASSAVLTILASGSEAVVLVPREYRAEILAGLDLPVLDDRVIGI